MKKIFKRSLSLLLSLALITAIALTTGCNDNKETPKTSDTSVSESQKEIVVKGEGKTKFSFSVTDKDGKTISSDSILKSGTKITLKYSNGRVADERIVVVPGDNDGDGEITANDARTALRAAVNLDKLNSWQKIASDVTETEKKQITSSDARELLRASVGLEKTDNWFLQLKNIVAEL